MPSSSLESPDRPLSGAILVAAVPLALGAVLLVLASRFTSVALVASSILFVEASARELLAIHAPRWTAAQRSLAGRVAAGVLLFPILALVATAWRRLVGGETPVEAEVLVGAGLAIALLALGLPGRLGRSAPTPALAAAAMTIGAGLFSYRVSSVWPDLAAGAGIVILGALGPKFRRQPPTEIR